MKGSKSANF